MLRIMSAAEAARKTVKISLEKEIPLINKAIEEAIEKKQKSCFYNERVSRATITILTRAGYDVRYLGETRVEISWSSMYNELDKNEKVIEELITKDTDVKNENG